MRNSNCGSTHRSSSSSITANAKATATKRSETGTIRTLVVACLTFFVVITTNTSVTLSFQQHPQVSVHVPGGRSLSTTTRTSLSESATSRTHSTTTPTNVPYGEANYDPHAADEFYKERPLKSIGRFLQIAGKSSRFVLDTTVFDEGESNTAAAADGTSGMTELERKRSQELVNLITALGPTFIKVGQALSTRTDLLPTDKAYYAIGLSQLQDAVDPSFDSTEARQIISDELGLQSVDEIFEWLSEEPVASASIGQVYKGKLRKNGMQVAVKVQRPNVLENVALDLYVMRSILAPLWNKFINSRNNNKKNSETNNPQQQQQQQTEEDINKSNTDSIALVDAWGEGFVNELDYRAEANATKAFTQAMKDRGLASVVFAPEVIDELSSTHVLTTQWVDGERLSDSDESDVPRLCGVALNAYLTMLLDTGTLHCDPHPGNLLRTPDGKLCILDWGMVLEVPNDLQLSLLEFIANLNAENYEDVPDDLVKLRFVPQDKIDDLRQSGLTVGIAKMLTLAAEGGGPKGAMQRMVAQNKEKYAEALKDFDDLDSEEATKVRQKLFREDWNRAMAEDAMSREAGDGDATSAMAPASTTVDVTTKIEAMRQQNTDVFAIPDYFVYMSRAFATLEGIGLASNENYSILQECYPYLAKRLLSDNSPRARKALQTLLYGKDGTELNLTKLQELSDGLESYSKSTSSVESGRNADSNEGRDAAIEQVANVLLSEDSNYVQELLLRETAVALDVTVREALQSPLEPILRSIPTTTAAAGTPMGANGGASAPAALNLLRPLTLPFELANASLELQSIDDVDKRRLENVRILTNLASGATSGGSPFTSSSSSSSNNRDGTNRRGAGEGLTNAIGKVAKEAAKRRLALARIGVRFGGTMASVQAERLRDRAASSTGGGGGSAELKEFLARNGAERLEALSQAIHSIDDQLGKRRPN